MRCMTRSSSNHYLSLRTATPFAETEPTVNGFMSCPLRLCSSGVCHPGLPPECGFLSERRTSFHSSDQRRELGSPRGAPGRSQWARCNDLTDAREQDVLSRNHAGDESAVSADKLSFEPIEKILVAHSASRGVDTFFMSDPVPLQLRHHRRRHPSSTARSRRPTALQRSQLSTARCACSAEIALGTGGVHAQPATEGTPAASPALTSPRTWA